MKGTPFYEFLGLSCLEDTCRLCGDHPGKGDSVIARVWDGRTFEKEVDTRIVEIGGYCGEVGFGDKGFGIDAIGIGDGAWRSEDDVVVGTGKGDVRFPGRGVEEWHSAFLHWTGDMLDRVHNSRQRRMSHC